MNLLTRGPSAVAELLVSLCDAHEFEVSAAINNERTTF